jgi:hypothetical protein
MVEANEGEAMKEQGRKAWCSRKRGEEAGDSTGSANEEKDEENQGEEGCVREGIADRKKNTMYPPLRATSPTDGLHLRCPTLTRQQSPRPA